MTDGLSPFGLFLISLFGQRDVSFDSTSEAMSVFGKVLKLFSFNSASIVEQNDFSFTMRKQLLLLLTRGSDRQMQKGSNCSQIDGE